MKRHLVGIFPGSANAYRNLKFAMYAGWFKAFPALASTMREFRQGASSQRVHRSSFGLGLVGPEYLITGFETIEIALIRERLKESDVLVDVGANIGLYTCLAASMGKRVIAVEPSPRNLRYLYQNIEMNHLTGVEVFPMGLSSRPGLAVLRGIGAQASFLDDWCGNDHRFNRHVETVSPMTTLDTIIIGNRLAGQRLLIKIDVEGFEYPVLTGSLETLTMRPRPFWMVECVLNRCHPGNQNSSFIETFKVFFERGYMARAASIDDVYVTREVVNRWVRQGFVDNDTMNFVFCP